MECLDPARAGVTVTVTLPQPRVDLPLSVQYCISNGHNNIIRKNPEDNEESGIWLMTS